MKTLMEKLGRMMATMLEVMEIEPGCDTASPVSDEELAAGNELNSDNHNLIELCW